MTDAQYVSCGHSSCPAVGVVIHDNGTTAQITWATPPGTVRDHRHYVDRNTATDATRE